MKSESVKIQINEKYLEMVPRLDSVERRLLKESIKVNGQREEIIVNQRGIILDGHTRYEICQELGIEPKIKIRHFVNSEQEAEYVRDANLARRQLSIFSKIEMIYADYKKSTAKRSFTGYKAQIFCDKIGVKETTFHYGIWLIENAPEQIKSALRSNNLSITPTALKLKKSKQLSKPNYNQRKIILECPSCKHQFRRSDARTVRREPTESKFGKSESSIGSAESGEGKLG